MGFYTQPIRRACLSRQREETQNPQLMTDTFLAYKGRNFSMKAKKNLDCGIFSIILFCITIYMSITRI